MKYRLSRTFWMSRIGGSFAGCCKAAAPIDRVPTVSNATATSALLMSHSRAQSNRSWLPWCDRRQIQPAHQIGELRLASKVVEPGIEAEVVQPRIALPNRLFEPLERLVLVIERRVNDCVGPSVSPSMPPLSASVREAPRSSSPSPRPTS